MPFKDIATSDSLLLREVPPADDASARQALRRMAVRAVMSGVLYRRIAGRRGRRKQDYWGVQPYDSYSMPSLSTQLRS